MAGQPPLPPGHLALFESYWLQLEGSSRGDVNAITVGTFLKKSQLKDATLQKIWDLSDPTGKGYLDKQGLFTALRLVAACQLKREPSLASIMVSDPPPKLVGVDLNRWTIDTNEKARYIATFESLQPINGLVSGQKAKQILVRSNLPMDRLGKIWALSDIDRDGNLDVEEFAVAMKLTQLCQQGENIPYQLPPSLIPPSKVAHLGLQPSSTTAAPGNSHAPSTAGKSMSDWVITPDVKAKYDTYFDGIDKDHVGLVTGDQARGLFMASNLPQQTLAFIWRLVDVEQSGRLNKEQFALAMYLISERVRGRELPQELPPHMIPPSKRGNKMGGVMRPGQSISPAPLHKTPPLSQASSTLSSFSAPPTSAASLLQSSAVPGGGSAGLLQPTGAAGASAQGGSSFTGLQPNPASSLPSISAPSSGLLQPSMAAPVASSGSSLHGASSFSHSNFPPSGGGILQPLSPSTTSTSSAGPTSGFATDFSSGQQGFTADFAAIRELDTVSGEIESIAKEKMQLNEDIALKQEQIRQRSGEINTLQAELEESTRQRDELERQKSEAQNQLENLDNEKARIEKDMAELKERCAKEKEEIERLKAEILDQEASKSQQEQEMNKQLLQLEALHKEHEELKNRVETSRSEINHLQGENQTVQRDINQVQEQINQFRKEQQILTVQLAQLPSQGRQGTPPSVISINELPSEVPGTHLTVGEADAISARATAGSSSPVSSISGFSTNSHLDDQPEERDRTETLTSVATTGQIHPPPSTAASDPFAAFTGDPFGSTTTSSSNATAVHGGGGSTFDPFDLSLFKIGGGGGGATTSAPMTSSTGGGFAVFSSVSSATPKSTDPFSSQDPFSSDPFASTVPVTQGKTDNKSSWGVEGTSDPFATPTGGPPGGSDPFSSDPFYSDPFGQGGGIFGSSSNQAGAVAQGFGTDPFLSMPDPSSGSR